MQYMYLAKQENCSVVLINQEQLLVLLIKQE